MTDYQIRIVVSGEDRASVPLGKVGSALGSMATIAGGILSAQMFQSIARGIMDMSAQALDATASWERMGLAMQSMIAREMVNTGEMKNLTEAMASAGPKAEELLGWLERLAINSPFDAEGVANTYRQALTFGFASDKARDLTQVLIDMSAGMGLTSFQMERVGYALGQINQSDRVLMQDLRQLMSVGVPVDDILKTMGYTMADVGKKAISSKDFVAAFNKEMGEGFEGAASKQAKSWAGLKNSIADIKNIGLREFFSSTFDALQPYVAKFVDKFSDPAFVDSLRKWGEPLGNMVKRAAQLFGEFEKIRGSLPKMDIAKIFEKIKASDMFKNIMKAASNFTEFWERNGAKISGILNGLGESLVKTFSPMLADMITFISEKFLLLSEWFNENAPLINEFLTVMAELFKYLGEAVAGMWEWIEPILSGLFDMLLELGTLIMQLVTGDWAGAWETMQEISAIVWEALKTAFWEFLDWIANLLGGSLEEIGAVWSANWEQFKNVVFLAWSAMTNWVNAKLTEIGLSILAGLLNIYITWKSNWEQFKTIAYSVWTIIAAWMQNKWAEIKSAFTAWLTGIVSQWSGNWEQFKTILSSAWAVISSTLSAKFNEVVSAIRNKINDFIKVGRDIVKGLENGIREAWSGLMETMKGLVAELQGTVTGALQIFSPSKVFEGYGKNIMEGWAQGLAKYSSLPIEATLQTSGMISQAASSSTTNNWNVTINNPNQNTNAVRDDIRLLQLAYGA